MKTIDLPMRIEFARHTMFKYLPDHTVANGGNSSLFWSYTRKLGLCYSLIMCLHAKIRGKP